MTVTKQVILTSFWLLKQTASSKALERESWTVATLTKVKGTYEAIRYRGYEDARARYVNGQYI